MAPNACEQNAQVHSNLLSLVAPTSIQSVTYISNGSSSSPNRSLNTLGMTLQHNLIDPFSNMLSFSEDTLTHNDWQKSRWLYNTIRHQRIVSRLSYTYGISDYVDSNMFLLSVCREWCHSHPVCRVRLTQNRAAYSDWVYPQRVKCIRNEWSRRGIPPTPTGFLSLLCPRHCRDSAAQFNTRFKGLRQSPWHPDSLYLLQKTWSTVRWYTLSRRLLTEQVTWLDFRIHLCSDIETTI